MKTKEALLLGATALVAIGGVMQIVEAWPQLAARTTTVRLVALALVHIGALGALVGVYMKSRKSSIGPQEVLYLAMLMFFCWSMDLGLVGR